MKELNRILIQLDNAVELANSALENEKKIAVILFDNLVEIQLLNKIKNIFDWDSTTWYSGSRNYSHKERSKATRYLDGMLKFSKKEGIISEEDYNLLSFSHNVRNEVYHHGDTKEYLLDISILIYISFIKDKIRKWKGSQGLYGMTSLPDYEPIDFGNGKEEYGISFSPEKYFLNNFDYIINKFDSDGKTIQEQLSENLLKEIDDIETRIEFVNKHMKTLNYYDVFGRYWYITNFFQKKSESYIKPKNIDRVLIIHNFLKKNKDELDDIDNLKIRHRRFNKLFNEHKKGWNNKYPYWVDLTRYKAILKSILKDDEQKAIQRAMQLQSNMLELFEDSEEASFELDGHIQELYDLYRGK